MKEEKQVYGSVTVGAGTNTPKQVEIIEFMQATFKDNRMANILELEDDSFVLSVENYVSSGRSNQSMLLSRESLFGILTVAMLFLEKRGINFQDELNKSLGNKEEVSYSCSKNLIDI